MISSFRTVIRRNRAQQEYPIIFATEEENAYGLFVKKAVI